MFQIILFSFLLTSMGIFFSPAATAQSAEPIKLDSVEAVDLQRYAGRWFEIAKYPNRFQKQCVADVVATYTLKPNGTIEVKNECRKKDGNIEVAVGEAEVKEKSSNSKLKVRFAPSWLSFMPFVWADYWIVDLDPDYSYAVVSEPDREYFWILSRTQKMNDQVYDDILKRAEAKGFDRKKVVKTPQG